MFLTAAYKHPSVRLSVRPSVRPSVPPLGAAPRCRTFCALPFTATFYNIYINHEKSIINPTV